MSGPQAAFDTIADVQIAYDATEVQSGDMVFVVDINSFVAVIAIPGAPTPTYIQPYYDSTVEVEEAQLPSLTPAIIWTGVPSVPIEPVIVGDCGTVNLSSGFLPAASNIGTGGNTDRVIPMNRDPNTDVNLTTNYDATALPTVDDVP